MNVIVIIIIISIIALRWPEHINVTYCVNIWKERFVVADTL